MDEVKLEGKGSITINGQRIDCVCFSYLEKPGLRIVRYYDYDFEGSFTLEMKDGGAFFESLRQMLQPRGYWLRRQSYRRRKLWRAKAKQLRLPYAYARDLFRTGHTNVRALPTARLRGRPRAPDK